MAKAWGSVLVGTTLVIACAAAVPEPAVEHAERCDTVADCAEARHEAYVAQIRCNEEAQKLFSARDCAPLSTAIAQAQEKAISLERRKIQQDAINAERDRKQGVQDMIARKEAEQSQRDTEAQRVEAVLRWASTVLRSCAARLSTHDCDAETTPDEWAVNDKERHVCRELCQREIDAVSNVASQAAFGDCINGKTKGCNFTLEGPSVKTAEIKAYCEQQCASSIASARPKPTPPTPAPAVVCGGNARCCDGACSPSCACPGHQGCCSHHGGVCGC